MEDVGEAIIAVIVSTLAAGFTAILAAIACMFLGNFLFTLGLISDEGSAWSGLSLGIPVGLVCAIVVFVCCFRKIRARGHFVE